MPSENQPLPELLSFLDTLPEPHILCDRDYRIIAANTAYRAGFAPGRGVIGRTCYEVSHRYSLPCDQAGETCPLARGLKSGQRERVLHLHHTPRGEEYVNIELSPLRDASGEIAWYIEKMEPLNVARGLSDRHGLVGRAPAFQHMLGLVARAAPSNASILLQGESGTGKELVANAIHEASQRAGHPFVAVDCSGLPETLFESELFGHERGAFTGATSRKAGLVEAASGGTLFLDEVGDIPLGMQVKLLRLLETGTYRRVGSTELRRADIRLVSATHRPLRQMSAQGSFRQDLYYRINTFPITVPPLRERVSDIPLLVESLLGRVAPGRSLRVSAAAMRVLCAHPFPGNVRELRNVLERASLMCDGDEITPAHLAEDLCEPAAPHGVLAEGAAESGIAPWETMEREHFLRVVQAHRGSRKALAEQLGLSERTLYRKLRQYRIG
ncbi:sigma-54-dependent Fis family transcriptional regulator [Pseudothauera nasutitermitis]|uniref:Sigma-54-dependent Fis family transcriptional regulator n=1 Tax=Pseudothauera nasutitermitis TaxID=2565930 RepID=A0A4S4APA1_9RHOO|nr:sigma-54-dependent Fis family transcriptional regulator [Pseudothauera nasutitermitis]THF61446.1 sigma-54-dependent Fis family transcriptional regulator [Pseudothauera nasutitermitis]